MVRFTHGQAWGESRTRVRGGDEKVQGARGGPKNPSLSTFKLVNLSTSDLSVPPLTHLSAR